MKLHVNTRNTLIDGELVIDRPKDESSPEIPRFLAFDLLLFNGTSLMHRPFHKRLGYLTQNVLKDYSKIPHPEAEFRLELKKLERSYALNIVWDSIPTLLHENDGLIFTSAEDPYAVGTCDSILKWKPPSMNSIDFRVDAVRMPDGDYKWDLSILESNQKYQLFGELVLDSEEMHRQWCADPPSGKIVECHYDAKWPTKWRFMRFRTDKNTPNHVSVVPKIMQSINEGIEIEEVILKEIL